MVPGAGWSACGTIALLVLRFNAGRRDEEATGGSKGAACPGGGCGTIQPMIRASRLSPLDALRDLRDPEYSVLSHPTHYASSS
jgi:hypothetical protein